MSIRLAIWKGMEHREAYKLPASETEITIRPLSQIEVDQCYADALDNFPRSAQETVVKMHANVLNPQDEIPENTRISDLQLYYNEVCYHIISTSSGISVHDIKKLPYGDKIRSLVDRIFRISGVDIKQSQKDIEWFLTNSDGLVLANLTAHMKVPITDKAWKITPLQQAFLIADKDEYRNIARTEKDIYDFFAAVSGLEPRKRDIGLDTG